MHPAWKKVHLKVILNAKPQCPCYILYNQHCYVLYDIKSPCSTLLVLVISSPVQSVIARMTIEGTSNPSSLTCWDHTCGRWSSLWCSHTVPTALTPFLSNLFTLNVQSVTEPLTIAGYSVNRHSLEPSEKEAVFWWMTCHFVLFKVNLPLYL